MNHLQHPAVSIVMPCLNEAETLATCIRKALAGLQQANVEGEIIIADNGSHDGSQEIAIREGARVVSIAEKGYGNALLGGIMAAKAPWIIMGDADDSYDFSNISPFIQLLEKGADLVMGCRMPAGGGTIMPGAMPWKHRWIGNPVLSFIGRLLFHCPARDFHCGLRAFTKQAFLQMELKSSGMEFASEMVIKATLKNLSIKEVPITLHKDGRSRPPHLRSWRDGWRHLRFMLLFSPRWLFLFPGIVLATLGVSGLGILFAGQMIFGRVVLDVGTMMVCSSMMLIGFQLVCLAVFTRVFAMSAGFLPPHKRLGNLLERFTLEWGIAAGVVLILTGIIILSLAFLDWQRAGFQGLDYGSNLRRIIPATTFTLLGIQLIFGSFFLGVLGLKPITRSTSS